MRIHRNRKLLVITCLLAIAIYPINLRAGYVPEAIQGYYRQAIANKAIEISNQNTDYDKYNRLGPTSFDCSGFAYYVYKKCGYSISSVCAASQAKEMEEKDIHYFSSHSVGNTYFWSKKPINGVEDLKGFKVRFFGSMSDTMEHFGASPVMLPHPETYMAIAMGTLDGSGTAWWLYRDLKLYEVCPYFIGPAWQVPQGMELWASKKAWDALPDDLKEIVTEAAKQFDADYARVCEEQEHLMFEQFEEWGTTYIEWGKEDIDRIVNEFSLPYLDKIDQDIGAKDPRVAEGVKIVKQFMKDRGYIE